MSERKKKEGVETRENFCVTRRVLSDGGVLLSALSCYSFVKNMRDEDSTILAHILNEKKGDE